MHIENENKKLKSIIKSLSYNKCVYMLLVSYVTRDIGHGYRLPQKLKEKEEMMS